MILTKFHRFDVWYKISKGLRSCFLHFLPSSSQRELILPSKKWKFFFFKYGEWRSKNSVFSYWFQTGLRFASPFQNFMPYIWAAKSRSPISNLLLTLGERIQQVNPSLQKNILTSMFQTCKYFLWSQANPRIRKSELWIRIWGVNQLRIQPDSDLT